MNHKSLSRMLDKETEEGNGKERYICRKISGFTKDIKGYADRGDWESAELMARSLVKALPHIKKEVEDKFGDD